MKKIFENSMREIWCKVLDEESSTDFLELRRYSEFDPPMPMLGASYSSSTSIYWGQSDEHSFSIGKPVTVSFWSFISTFKTACNSTSLENMILSYVSEAVKKLEAFPAEAEKRLRGNESDFVHFLPRDFRELLILINDPYVIDAFNKAGIDQLSVESDIRFLGAGTSSEKRIDHGCFRFRNFGIGKDGELVIIAGDDLVWGCGLYALGALVADLLELNISNRGIGSKSLRFLYENTIRHLDYGQMWEINKILYLYILAHHAQYIHTWQFTGRLTSLEVVREIINRGIHAVIEQR